MCVYVCVCVCERERESERVEGSLCVVASFHTPGGERTRNLQPLNVSLGASLESRPSPCS